VRVVLKDTARPTPQPNLDPSAALAALCPKDAVTLVTLTRLFVTKTHFGALVSQCRRGSKWCARVQPPDSCSFSCSQESRDQNRNSASDSVITIFDERSTATFLPNATREFPLRVCLIEAAAFFGQLPLQNTPPAAETQGVGPATVDVPQST